MFRLTSSTIKLFVNLFGKLEIRPDTLILYVAEMKKCGTQKILPLQACPLQYVQPKYWTAQLSGTFSQTIANYFFVNRMTHYRRLTVTRFHDDTRLSFIDCTMKKEMVLTKRKVRRLWLKTFLYPHQEHPFVLIGNKNKTQFLCITLAKSKK